jgi:hypothetical protein
VVVLLYRRQEELLIRSKWCYAISRQKNSCCASNCVILSQTRRIIVVYRNVLFYLRPGGLLLCTEMCYSISDQEDYCCVPKCVILSQGRRVIVVYRKLLKPRCLLSRTHEQHMLRDFGVLTVNLPKIYVLLNVASCR